MDRREKVRLSALPGHGKVGPVVIVFGHRHTRIIEALDGPDPAPRVAPKGYKPTALVAKNLGLPVGSVAGHLRIMQRKGWVERVKSGGVMAYRASPEGRHLAAMEKMRRENMAERKGQA